MSLGLTAGHLQNNVLQQAYSNPLISPVLLGAINSAGGASAGRHRLLDQAAFVQQVMQGQPGCKVPAQLLHYLQQQEAHSPVLLQPNALGPSSAAVLQAVAKGPPHSAG